MTNTYTRAYTEVIEILSHLSEEEYAKIPIAKIEFYKNNMDKQYSYKINPKVNLSEQNISKEANAILISLFRDYFTNEKQKSTLENILRQNQLKEEKEKKEKYTSNDIFSHIIETPQQEPISIMEYKETFISKFLNKIKSIFNK